MDAAASFNGEAMELTIIKIWLMVTNYEKITRTLFLGKVQVILCIFSFHISNKDEETEESKKNEVEKSIRSQERKN